MVKNMTEKRFIVMSNDVKQLYCIVSAEGEMFSNQEVADLLNSLSSKNMQLHHTNKELEKENEELRKENMSLIENNCIPCELVNLQTEHIDSLEKTIQHLRKLNEKFQKERDYWEQSSKHRQRLLEDSEKEIRLHNAYLVDNNIGEDYQRWRRSNK